MVCNASFYPVPQTDHVIEAFFWFDLVSGIILIIFSIIYTFFFVKDCRNSVANKDNDITHQIVFSIALLWKGISLLISATLRDYKDSNWGLLSVLITGSAGYMSAIAYCFIFFTWTALCANYLGHDFAVFYKNSRRLLLTLVCIVVGMLVISVSFMYFSTNEEFGKIFHYAEASFASARDIIIAIFFILYFKKVLGLAEAPYCGKDKPETKIFLMCGILISILIFRAASILFYAFYWSDWGNLAGKCREFNGYSYFIDYSIEQVLFEFLPLLYIGGTRIHQIIDTAYTSLEVNEADFSYPA